MALRLEYRDLAPRAIRALSELNAYSADSSIPQRLRRLIEIRVSQLNGCSYCIAVHTRQCLELGETAERLAALDDWRRSRLFSPAERAALAWSESVTLIKEQRAPEAEYVKLTTCFTEIEAFDITFVALAMNAWNRLSIAFGREAEHERLPTDRTSQEPRP